jgi:peptide/nickel transport system substrate-binding protein
MFNKPRPQFLMIALSLLAAMTLLLSACGQGTPTTSGGSGGSTASSKPVPGGTWIDDLYEEPDSLLPNNSVETFALMVNQTLWAPLFYGDSSGVVHPGLASEMPTVANGDVSSDLKTWTFKLKPNLQWSDGQPLNADDVDFTWKLWNSGKYTVGSSVGFNLITSADVSADKQAITFHLKEPFGLFMTSWIDGSFAPMPAHVLSKMPMDQIQKSKETLNPSVTSGPFMMKEAVQGNHYTVVKNPKYYRASEGLPYLDSIVFKIVPDQDTIFKDFQAGSITSSWFLDVTKTNQYKTLSTYYLPQNPATVNFEAIYFNLKNPALQDVNVRKAMAMDIDQKQLITTARLGNGVPLCTDHGSGYHPGYQADAPCPKYDPSGAGALLDSAGWKLGSDGVRHKGNLSLVFTYETTAKNPWRAADEQILQAAFKQIGIKLNIQNYPASTYFGTNLPQGKFDIGEFETSWNNGYDADDSSGFACDQVPTAANNYSGGNYSTYCNPELDKLFKQEANTLDPAQRQQIFNEIHKIYLTDFPYVTLYGPTDLSVVKKGTHNYLPLAYETSSVWSWWCEGGKC